MRKYVIHSPPVPPRDGLACLTVTEIQHKARMLRSISNFVEGKDQQLIPGHVEDLIQAVDQIDQVLCIYYSLQF